jgi:DNA repair exonuclease SbcCD nuclease subunit
MARLVCIGDIHLVPGERNPQRLRSLDQIIEQGIDLPDLGAWVLTGDIFDRKSEPADRNAFVERLALMLDHAPAIIVKGNHDAEGDLDIYAHVRERFRAHVVTQPVALPLLLATRERVTALCLPYPQKAALAAAGVAPTDVLDAADAALDSIFLGFAASADEARAAGQPVFFAAHANISGSIASNGQPSIAKEISVTAAHLDRLGAMPKIFGHIHLPQEIAGAVYCGSVSSNSWGETERKRALVVDLATGAIDSIPLDTPRLFHADGTLTRDGFTWALADEATPPDRWEGCEVRVRVRFHQSEKAALDFALARVPFEGAARLVVEPVAIPDRALRAPEVAAARTLAEKVEAWAQHVGTSASDSVLAKLGRLEQSDPEHLVREVQLWLAEVEAGELAEVAS